MSRFAVPPALLDSQEREEGEPSASHGLAKRRRESSPELCRPHSSPEMELIADSCGSNSSPDIIDLTQD